jgi:membrane protein insertase Oxa1/YidC/SpoIIIJ
MGRTVPAYRLAAVRERRRWTVFRERLDKSERKLFDEMMSYPQLYNVAGIGACKPVLIQPMLMSIVFGHYKQLKKIAKQYHK